MLKTSFSFTDEFGQESTLSNTFTEDVLETTDAFYLLLDEFKNFLIGAGFSQDTVSKIQIQEE